MKIAYLSTFYPFRGGIAQFNASLYRTFEKQHTVRAFTFTRQYPDLLFPGKSQYVTPDDHADPIPSRALLDTVNPLSYRRTALELAAFAPDMLVMKFWMPFFAPSLGYVAGYLRRRGTKVITVLDNVIPHEKRPGDMALIRYFLRRNSGFVAMSKTVEQDLLALMPDARYTLKAHPLYDHYGPAIARDEACAKLGIPKNKKTILFFGFIRDYKGLDLLIRSVARLSESHHLIIAGEVYGSFDKYQALINELGLQNRISLFTRYIDDAEVPLFFSAAQCCVLPYRSATQSGIVQIAYHYHLPVLVTDVGGLSEMVSGGQTGAIIPKAEPESIATVISDYFDKGYYEAMSQAIAGRRAEYSWHGFAVAIEKLYAQVSG